MKFTTVRKNPFGIAKKNNNVIQAVENFAQSNIRCAKVDAPEYHSANNCLFVINQALKKSSANGIVEAHIKNGDVYIMRSEFVDRSKTYGNYHK